MARAKTSETAVTAGKVRATFSLSGNALMRALAGCGVSREAYCVVYWNDGPHANSAQLVLYLPNNVAVAALRDDGVMPLLVREERGELEGEVERDDLIAHAHILAIQALSPVIPKGGPSASVIPIRPYLL